MEKGISKILDRLNKRFNRVTQPTKSYDLYDDVISLSIKYVSPEILRYGIDERTDSYYYLLKNWIRNNYGNGKLALPGDRIRLIKMNNDPNPIEYGATGTVKEVNSIQMFGEDQLVVDWDNGRGLNLIVGEDEFEVIEKGQE